MLMDGVLRDPIFTIPRWPGTRVYSAPKSLVQGLEAGCQFLGGGIWDEDNVEYIPTHRAAINMAPFY